VIKGLVLFAFPKFVSGREEGFSLSAPPKKKLLIILPTLQVRVQHPTPIELYYVLRKYSQYLIIKELELLLLFTQFFIHKDEF
jgi:hypothetical protein